MLSHMARILENALAIIVVLGVDLDTHVIKHSSSSTIGPKNGFVLR